MTTEDDRLRLLSPEEREALDNDDYDEDEDNQAALDEIGRGKIEDDADDGDNTEGDADAAEDADDAKAGDAEQDADDEAADADAAKDEQPGSADAPVAKRAEGYNVEAPADLDEKLKVNRRASAELRRQFNDGDLDADEYDAKVEELEDERDTLRDLKTRATIAAEMRQQNEANTWVNTINDFISDTAKDGERGIVDYAKDEEKQADLDSFVKAIANKPGNENKPMRWYLEEAHKRVVALHGVPTSKKAADGGKRKADASKVVNSLAEVPGGAGDTDPAADEFADLDKLQGMDYERALAAMPKAKRDRYLLLA